ncbi:MAG: PAS domain S-box protein, partial [Thermosynechococcaceae cyanobacterium]
YQQALSRRQPGWNSIDRALKPSSPTLTFSEPLYGVEGRLLGVVGVEVALTYFRSFLRSLSTPQPIDILIADFRDSWAISATSSMIWGDQPNPIQPKSEAKGRDSLLAAAIPALKRISAQTDKVQSLQSATFQFQGSSYVLWVAPLRDVPGLNLSVAVVVSNPALTQQIQDHGRETLLLCVVVLLTAVLFGLIAARRLSQGLQQLIAAGQALAESAQQGFGVSDPHRMFPNSHVAELSQLAQTFNRMAHYLKQSFDELETRVQLRTAALKQSEEKFAKIFYHHPNPIAISRLEDGCFVDANESALSMLGYERNEFIGKSSVDLNTGTTLEQRQQAILSIQTQGPIRGLESHLRTKSGEIKTILYSADLIELDGEVHLISIVHDITDRKRIEEALRRSEEKFAKVFHANPSPMTISRVADGYFLEANASAAQFLETDRSEVVGKTSFDLQIWVDPQQRHQFLQTLQHHAQVQSQECVLRTTLGNYRTVLFSAEMVDIDGQLCLISIINDISDRRQAAEALQQAEEKYRSIFENSVDGIFQSTPTGQFLSANPALAEIYGYESPEALLDELTNIHQQLYVNPQRRADFISTIEQQEAISNFESQAYRRDGRIIWVSENARAVRDEQNQLLYYEGTVKDITDKKVAEEALRYAKADAEAANQAKSVFLSNMSHELRTPLNAILGFTQVLRRDPMLSAQQQEQIDIIHRSGEYLLDMINDVLDMAKIEAGRTQAHLANFDLYQLLETLERMFRLKAESKALALMFHTAANVPQFIKTDEGKLRQILINLLGNAIKFTQHGTVSLTVRSASLTDETGGQALQFEVEDTGPGIALHELDTIFEPFIQSHLGPHPQTGTGLGLPISREFAHLLGGELSVSSCVGEGSHFYLHLPIEIESVSTVNLKAASRRRQVVGLAAGQPRYRLLVVDDRWESRKLIANLLEPLGFEVRDAENGQVAIALWEQWEPHLIWMDMQMPVMDGYTATQYIKSHLKGQATVIIALTASALDSEKEIVLSAGCDDFVRKPFREETIFSVLEKHLNVRFAWDDIPATVFRETNTSELENLLNPDNLKQMPVDWIKSLHQAAQEVNNPALLTLIDQIPESNYSLAKSLNPLLLLSSEKNLKPSLGKDLC